MSHMKIYRAMPVASIPRRRMYLYTRHGGNDSAGRVTLFEEIEPAAMATLAAEQFPFLEIAGSTG
jgi:hypothetical protein